MNIKCSYSKLLSPSELIPHPGNENDHTDKQINALAKIIAKVGQRSPIVISNESGKIVKGHGTLKALKKLGWEKVAVDIQSYESELEEFNHRVADNEIARYAKLDESKFLYNLKSHDLSLKEVDFEEFGLLDFELPNEETFEGQTDEDEVPEVENPITRRGDIWLLGKHRLMCGDSTMIDEVEKLMDKKKPDFIHTDPPYGMNAVTKSGVLSANYKIDILGDDNPDVAKDCFELIQGLYPESKQIWWGANYYSSTLPDSENWIVWDKNNGGSDQADCELAWGNFRTVVRMFKRSSEKTNRVHPTQKPVELIEWFLESKRFKLEPKLIADYFGGSGSTLIASEKKNIPCYVMEFDPKFSDVIINRWQNYTGKKATLEATCELYDELKNSEASANG